MGSTVSNLCLEQVMYTAFSWPQECVSSDSYREAADLHKYMGPDHVWVLTLESGEVVTQAMSSFNGGMCDRCYFSETDKVTQVPVFKVVPKKPVESEGGQ